MYAYENNKRMMNNLVKLLANFELIIISYTNINEDINEEKT